jgi:hypothetical protein
MPNHRLQLTPPSKPGGAAEPGRSAAEGHAVDESDLFAARYCPGFSPVLTSWQVYISRSRWLRQKVVVYDHESTYHNQVLWFWNKLARQEMAEITEIVERIGFRAFNQHYQHETMCVTDCPSYFVSIRFGKWVKEVEAYDLPRLAEYERQPAAIGLKELWEAITAHAPFEKVPIEQGLPRPWWRFW